MNKTIESFFTRFGMEKTSANTFKGNIGGFEANGIYVASDAKNPVRFHLSFFLADKQPLISELKLLGLKYFAFTVTNMGILLMFNGFTVSSMNKDFDEKFNKVLEVVSKHALEGANLDPVTGEAFLDDARVVNINGMQIKLNSQTIESINSQIEQENADFDEMPNNYLKGFLGAFLGALVGVILQVVLSLVGFVSAISAVVAVVVGEKLYRAFKGKPNKVMVIIVSITSFVVLCLGVFGVYCYLAVVLCAVSNNHTNFFNDFITCMKMADFSNSFYSDLGLTALFTAIGVAIEIAPLLKKTKRNQKIN